MAEPFLRIYGSNDWCPLSFNDCSHYLLDDAILIDTGWKGVSNLIDDQIDPLKVHTLLLTHRHLDHRLGLASWMMYHRIKRGTLGGLTIAGPAEDIEDIYRKTLQFVFDDDEPGNDIAEGAEIVGLQPGEILGTRTHIIECAAGDHGVPERMYKITNKATMRVIGFTGDTAYTETIGAFFKGTDTLICECTMGAIPKNKMPHGTKHHMNLWDVAKVAQEVQPEQLVLTHTTKDRDLALELIRPLVSCDVFWAEPGDMLLY